MNVVVKRKEFAEYFLKHKNSYFYAFEDGNKQ